MQTLRASRIVALAAMRFPGDFLEREANNLDIVRMKESSVDRRTLAA